MVAVRRRWPYGGQMGSPSTGVRVVNVARCAAQVLDEHTTLELECIDRMYLNVYVPVLQTGAGASYFFRQIRGNPMPSSALMAPITRRFVSDLEGFAKREGVDLIRFERGERKDERTKEYLRRWAGGEGVLYIGKAQERARVLRTERRHDPATGAPYPWLADTTAMVNHYFVYLVDEDFGPLFVKFVLPLQRQGLSERARVRQAPVGQARYWLRGAGQRAGAL